MRELDFVGFNRLVREIYGDGEVPLHRPIFVGSERKYLVDCIDSNFVSSVGVMVSKFEGQIAAFTGARYAVATVNGTSALHIALKVAGVNEEEEVLTQPLTFVATCNAIRYLRADPVFLDVDRDTMGLSPTALSKFLNDFAIIRDGFAWNSRTGKRIAACVPMHTFGIPCRISELAQICESWNIPLIEDAAESLGSYVGNKHTGTFGLMGVLSFNGNKVVTTGGGGAIFTDNEEIARRAKHLTTTAKVPHPFDFVHDEVGFNYRMPNLNAALGCAQIENINWILERKRLVHKRYSGFFSDTTTKLVESLPGDLSNYWLNAIILNDRAERDSFLEYTNGNGLMTRPAWRLMIELDMFRSFFNDGAPNAHWLWERVVNIPSSVPDFDA